MKVVLYHRNNFSNELKWCPLLSASFMHLPIEDTEPSSDTHIISQLIKVKAALYSCGSVFSMSQECHTS